MATITELADLAKLIGTQDNTPATGPYPPELAAQFSPDLVAEAAGEITSWPGYAPSPLRSLDRLADAAGVGSVFYKDESGRFGLGSFKALGGAYAVIRYLAGALSQESGKPVAMGNVRSGDHADAAAAITVATATDGNHGRSVAWGAQMAGCRCRIYIHREVSEGRAAAMAAFGAEVIRVDGDYDESVRQCARDAAGNGWQVISDTSYDGYTQIPRYVMAGYTIMVQEILDQCGDELPSHVIIQAGVGGLAAAILAVFWMRLGERLPRFIIVESQHSDCVAESFRQNRAASVDIATETMMAGLSCGEISLIAWDILSRGVSHIASISDQAVAPAMRAMAAGEMGGGRIEAGECAVPGIITLLAAAGDNRMRQRFGLTAQSRILVFGCEGATDRAIYDRILAGAER